MNPSGKCSGGIFCCVFRLYLIGICQSLALSVICHANASSPKGRAKKPEGTAHLTNQVDLHTDLFACCSFRHGLCRATFLREEGFGFACKPTCLSLWERCRAATERAGSLFEGAECRFAARLREQPTNPDESGYLLYKLVRVSPSQSFASQMPALPKGEPRSWCEPHT